MKQIANKNDHLTLKKNSLLFVSYRFRWLSDADEVGTAPDDEDWNQERRHIDGEDEPPIE